MGSLEKINNKIHKLKYNISLLKSRKKTIEKSKNKKLRIERARKLLKLGILFEMTSTDNFSIAVLISYLENLHSLKDRDFNLYQENGEIYLKNRRAKYGE